jgi:hypothetical protein
MTTGGQMMAMVKLHEERTGKKILRAELAEIDERIAKAQIACDSSKIETVWT